MKKALILILALLLIVALSACDIPEAELQNPTQPTTEPVIEQTQPPATEPAIEETQPVTQPPATEPVIKETQPVTQPPATEPVIEETQPVTQPPATEPVIEETQPATQPPATEPVVEETQPATQPPATEPVTQPTEKKAISKDRAIVIALRDAGESKDTVVKMEAELDKERNGLYWEVEFETREYEYSYEIHAYDAVIVKKEVSPQEPQPATQPTTAPATQPAEKKAISKDRAIEIALQDAGLSKNSVWELEAELDKERNGLYWEVEFETREYEYSYDIQAYDAVIAKKDISPQEQPAATQKPTEPQDQTISKARAIEIALEAAGLEKNAVSELDAELDDEGKTPYWEVSFETRKYEYSYEINANDGTVMDSEKERND